MVLVDLINSKYIFGNTLLSTDSIYSINLKYGIILVSTVLLDSIDSKYFFRHILLYIVLINSIDSKCLLETF